MALHVAGDSVDDVPESERPGFQELLVELKGVMTQQATIETFVRPGLTRLQERESELRSEILTLMQSHGVRGYQGSGLTASEVVTKSWRIADEDKLTAVLEERGVLAQLTIVSTSFDMKAVKKLADESDGLAGLERVEQRTLRIKQTD